MLAALAGGMLLATGGCIHPLYGPNGVSAKLSQVEVAPIPERVGHYLAEELKFQTDGSGRPSPPRYRLTVVVESTAAGIIVNIHTLSTDSAAVSLTATYTLTEIGSDRQVAQGVVGGAASYDRSAQRFANVRAARDAEIRAAGSAAEQIRTRIGIALMGQP